MAQDPAPEDHTIRISVNLVEVDAVVMDKKGNAVRDLTAADFEILQNGKRQQIRSAQWVPWSSKGRAEVPQTKAAPHVPVMPGQSLTRGEVDRTIAIVVDDLGLSFESISRLKVDLKRYLRENIQAGDLVAVITTGRSMGAMSQFTSDKRLLLAAVDGLRWNSFGRQGASSIEAAELGPEELSRRASVGGRSPLNPDTDPEVTRKSRLMTGTLASVRNVVTALRAYPGRKSVLLISENLPLVMRSQRGDPSQGLAMAVGAGAMNELRELGDEANRSFVVIDSMDPRGLQPLELSAADDTRGMSIAEVNRRMTDRRLDSFQAQNGLAYLAEETGGTFQRNNNDIAAMLRKAVDGVGGYYLLTYRPDSETFEGKAAAKFHRVEVRVKRDELQVRSRKGFYGRQDRELAASGPKTLQEAMLSPLAQADVRVRMTGYHVEDPKQGSVLTALLHVNGADLAFEPAQGGGFQSKIDVVSVTFGSDGKVESQSAHGFALAIKDEAELTRVKRNGIVYTVHHPVKKAGGFQLRVGLKERASGKMGTASQYVEVPEVKKGGLMLTSLLVQTTNKGERITGGPAVRIFPEQDELVWGARILNARRGKDNQPKLTRRVVIYREGKVLFQSADIQWAQQDVDDQVRLPVLGVLKLGADMAPGDYVLQLVVTDELEPDAKKRTASQVIDFEVTARRS